MENSNNRYETEVAIDRQEKDFDGIDKSFKKNPINPNVFSLFDSYNDSYNIIYKRVKKYNGVVTVFIYYKLNISDTIQINQKFLQQALDLIIIQLKTM